MTSGLRFSQGHIYEVMRHCHHANGLRIVAFVGPLVSKEQQSRGSTPLQSYYIDPVKLGPFCRL
jgi:hypothetical protein